MRSPLGQRAAHAPGRSEGELCPLNANLANLAGVSYRYDGRTIENRRGLIGCHHEVLARVLPVAQQIAREAGLA